MTIYWVIQSTQNTLLTLSNLMEYVTKYIWGMYSVVSIVEFILKLTFPTLPKGMRQCYVDKQYTQKTT